MTDFHAIVPARMASTRLPNKPLADIAGKPMVVWVAERARAAGARSVTIATDHPDIATAARSHGIDAVLTRADHPSGTDRLAEAAQLLGLSDDDLVVNVQGDEPLMDPRLVAEVARVLACSPQAAVATAAHPLTDLAEVLNPNIVKVVLDAAGLALYFSRAPIPWPRDAWANGPQALPAGLPVYRHIGIYGYRVRFLARYGQLTPAPIEQFESLEQLRVLWHGERIAVHLTERAPAAGVDTADDLARVRALLAE